MVPIMAPSPDPLDDLLRRARAGDAAALAALFTSFRERLRRMIHLRLDRRLTGRVDASSASLAAQLLGTMTSPAPAVGDARWKAGTARTADGYVIEFEIPLDLIDTQDGPGFRPAATGSELRMN
jgi:hypothetical protein